MKIRPVGAEFFHADRRTDVQTDVTNLIIAFRIFFANAPKTELYTSQKTLLISNFMKIRPVGAELFHADRRTDGQTDITNLIIAFSNFFLRTRLKTNFILRKKKHRFFATETEGLWCHKDYASPLDAFINAQHSGHERKVGVYMYKTAEVRNDVSHPCQTWCLHSIRQLRRLFTRVEIMNRRASEPHSR